MCKAGMYVRKTSDSVHVKGWKCGELAALGDFGSWGFPQVALRKFADWPERFAPRHVSVSKVYSYSDWQILFESQHVSVSKVYSHFNWLTASRSQIYGSPCSTGHD